MLFLKSKLPPIPPRTFTWSFCSRTSLLLGSSIARQVMLTGGFFQRKLLFLTGHKKASLFKTQIRTKRELNHQVGPPNAHSSGKSQLLSLAMTPIFGLSGCSRCCDQPNSFSV